MYNAYVHVQTCACIFNVYVLEHVRLRKPMHVTKHKRRDVPYDSLFYLSVCLPVGCLWLCVRLPACLSASVCLRVPVRLSLFVGSLFTLSVSFALSVSISLAVYATPQASDTNLPINFAQGSRCIICERSSPTCLASFRAAWHICKLFFGDQEHWEVTEL